MNLKDGNKRTFKDLKICQAVKGKFKTSMVLRVHWTKLQSSSANSINLC